MPAKERTSIIMRTESYTTELSSCLSDSEYLVDSSLRVNELGKPLKQSISSSMTSSTKRSSSGSVDELYSMNMVLPKLQPVLLVKTQKESLQSSLDDKLKRNTHVTTNKVSFSTLHIREFARRPGANPGCRIGVSLELDWELQDEQKLGVEEYETNRAPRRDRGELNIPSETRMQMMRNSGYSRGEILQYVKMANIARGQRTRTNETLQLAGAQELAQSIFRGIRNKTTHRGKKKKEKQALRMSLIQDQKLTQLRRTLTAPAAATGASAAAAPRTRRCSLALMGTPEQAPVAGTTEGLSPEDLSDSASEDQSESLSMSAYEQEEEEETYVAPVVVAEEVEC